MLGLKLNHVCKRATGHQLLQWCQQWKSYIKAALSICCEADEADLSILQFNGRTIEVCGWMSNFIQHLTGHMITHLWYLLWAIGMVLSFFTGNNFGLSSGGKKKKNFGVFWNTFSTSRVNLVISRSADSYEYTPWDVIQYEKECCSWNAFYATLCNLPQWKFLNWLNEISILNQSTAICLQLGNWKGNSIKI